MTIRILREPARTLLASFRKKQGFPGKLGVQHGEAIDLPVFKKQGH